MKTALTVYRDSEKVGTLYDGQSLCFVYADTWLRAPHAEPISPALPLQADAFDGAPVHAFFENLLPEGAQRAWLEISRHATTVFGLLRSVGGDTAGGLVLLPEGERPAPPHYVPTTWQAIADRLRHGTAMPTADASDQDIRISLAGAQQKLLLMVLPDGRPAYPQGTAPSTHLLKPDIQGVGKVWKSALNETLVMHLADALALGVAETSYQPDTGACLIKRYDRMPDGAGGLRRLHQLDLCQLAGKPSTVKYESDGGPGLALCRRLLQDAGVPATDVKRLIRWMIFNLCVGNHDSHAKNLSVLNRQGHYELAPFYDLMNTAIYPGLSRTFAFRIGGEHTPSAIGRAQLVDMAGELGFASTYVLSLAHAMTRDLPGALASVEQDFLHIAATGTEQTLVERLCRKIRSDTAKFAKRWEMA